MRLYFLLLISSILVIGCRTDSAANDEDSSSTPTFVVPNGTVIQPTLLPEITPSPPPLEESTPEVLRMYTNELYGFSFDYPSSWTIVELPNLVSLVYKGTDIALHIGFRRSGEDVELQQYSGAAGDFVSRGTLVFLGDTVEKEALVYQGVDKQIHYNETEEINRGDLFFTLAVESNSNNEEAVIPGEVQAAAGEILASFEFVGGQE